jgi:GT2 family glycosyltransferase
MPLIHIITINWNGLEDTLECLKSLKNIDYPNFNITVIDNGSKEKQIEIISKQFPTVRIIRNSTNVGFVNANNQGIKLALKEKADFILLINNDTIVDNQFLKKLVITAKQNENIGLISPKILYYKSHKVWCMGGKISILTGITILIGKGKNSEKYNKIIYPDFISGCAMLVKADVINRIGLLDPMYFAYFEDVDYSYRAKKAGFKLAVIPNSIIWHKKTVNKGIFGSRKLNSVQAYYWGRNSILFAKKNLNQISRIFYYFGSITFRFIHIILIGKSPEFITKYIQGINEGFKYEIHPK